MLSSNLGQNSDYTEIFSCISQFLQIGTDMRSVKQSWYVSHCCFKACLIYCCLLHGMVHSQVTNDIRRTRTPQMGALFGWWIRLKLITGTDRQTDRLDSNASHAFHGDVNSSSRICILIPYYLHRTIMCPLALFCWFRVDPSSWFYWNGLYGDLLNSCCERERNLPDVHRWSHNSS
jgi:hypothetical protein